MKIGYVMLSLQKYMARTPLAFNLKCMSLAMRDMDERRRGADDKS